MPNVQTSAKWYEIKAQGEAAAAGARTAEIYIYGNIGDRWDENGVVAADLVRELAALDVDTITLRINSYGGSVPDGLAIFNALKRHKASIDVQVDGVAISCAGYIAMAGDTVTMAANAMLMIHAPWGIAVGNSAELRDQADMLDKYAAAMATSYAGKSGKSREDCMALLTDGKDHWYTAEEAQSEGFCDTVGPAVNVAASIARSYDLSRFSTPAAAAATHQEITMPEVTPAAPAATPFARTKDMNAEILAFFKPFASREGVADLQTAILADPTITVEAASSKLLTHLAKDTGPAVPAGAHPVIETVEDETDKVRAAVVQSVLARAGLRDGKGEVIRVDASNPFRGHKLLDIARASLDRAGRSFGEPIEMFQHQQLECAVGAAAGLDDLFEAFALLGQDFKLAPGLRRELRVVRIRFGLSVDAFSFRFGFRLNHDTGFFRFGRRLELCAFLGFHSFGLCEHRLGHRTVLDFEHCGFCFPLPAFADLVRLGFSHLQFGLRTGDLRLREVFAFDCLRIGGSHANTLVAFRRLHLGFPAECGLLFADDLLPFQIGKLDLLVPLRLTRPDRLVAARIGDLDRLVAFGRGDARFAHAQVVRHVAASLLDGLRCGLLADGVDITRLVRDVRDVDVDELKADLAQLRLERMLHVLEEHVAVAIDLLDVHRSDDLPQLAEDHFLGLLADLRGGKPEQSHGRVLHDLGPRIDGDREDARHVYPDVLRGQRTAKRHFDLDRLEAQVREVLQKRYHECGTAMNRARRAAFVRAAVNHQHAVTRTPLVLPREENHHHQEEHGREARCDEHRDPPVGGRDNHG